MVGRFSTEAAISDRPTEPPAGEPQADGDAGQDVHVVETGGRTFILVGTAHVSQESADLVREVIERERPDRVCVELDEQRFKALSEKKLWESLDIKQVIKKQQLPTLLVNLLLGSYQKRLGGKLGVMPGTELLEATKVADELGIPVSLCDRNIRITMLRAWRSMSFWKKNELLASILVGLGGGEELTEEDLRKLRQKDVLTELMNELAKAMPGLKRVLIDERDAYLAEKIRQAEGQRIVAVVGAGHVEGMRSALAEGRPSDLEPLEQIPKALPVAKWIGWAIPAIILGSLGLIAWTRGGDVAGQNAIFWVLANSILCGIGAILALAHPLTVLAAVVAAPITSLIPVIGAGYVTAFVQAWVRPPRVRDFQSVTEEIARFRSWWSNLLLRVFLAFLLPSIGSIIGTWVAGSRIVSNLFG